MAMTSVVRSAAKRAVAQQWTRSVATPLVATVNKSSASVLVLRAQTQQQTRSFGVFQNLKDTVTTKMEERNQVKQGACTCTVIVFLRANASKASQCNRMF